MLVSILLTITMVGLFALAVAYFRLRVERDHYRSQLKWSEQNLSAVRDELKFATEELDALSRVIRGDSGGLVKRLLESAETASAIDRHAPDLWAKYSSLRFNLYAMDRFLHALYVAAAVNSGFEDRYGRDARELVLGKERPEIFKKTQAEVEAWHKHCDDSAAARSLSPD